MYYILFGLFYLLSLLPLRVLYLLSDFFYFLIYYVIGYRKEVVMNNLSIAFPEKTVEEKKRIAQKVYRNLTDTFIETIKLMSASRSFITNHMKVDAQPFEELYKRGKKIQLHLGHNFNWEIANLVVPLVSSYTMLTVYMPVSSKAVDRLLLYIRKRTGCIMIAATKIRLEIIPHRNKTYAIALVADQNPGNPKRAYWFNFFGRPTPFLIGPEQGARSVDAAVVFCYITKIKRGYYEGKWTLVTEDPKSLPEKELTAMYVSYLEDVIRKNPEMWLWTHRRWKWEWKEEYGEVIR